MLSDVEQRSHVAYIVHCKVSSPHLNSTHSADKDESPGSDLTFPKLHRLQKCGSTNFFSERCVGWVKLDNVYNEPDTEEAQ